MITDAKIKALPTPRLLAYYKKYRFGSVITVLREDIGKLVDKAKHLEKVKKELDSREHIGR